MNEMYWLTRLTSIVNLGGLFCFFGWLTLIVFSICYFIINSEYNTSGYESDKKWVDFWAKCIKVSSIFAIIGTIITIFVPTTKEAFMIWGVGSTIDYIKSNEKAQQLPDKCIDYLDAWVEQITKEKNE